MPPAAIRAALERALAAEDRDALWAALAPVQDQLTEDRDVARVWAEALRTSPARRSLVEEADRILTSWPGDPGIVGSAADALVRAAERRPVDEPPLAEGPASIAASALGRCLGRLSPPERGDPEVGGRLTAARGNALSLLGPLRYADAVEALEAAIALDPEQGDWHFDLGLVHKRQRAFDRALEATRRARQLQGDRKPVLWNLAIAATGAGDGAAAEEAWRALGLAATAAPDRLPFVEGLDPVEVRVATLGPGHGVAAWVPEEAAGFELVGVQPLSPCHGVVRTPTFRDARTDFGDVILWDPRPIGVRRDGDRPVPRFPLLAVLKAGDERRYRFLALQQQPGEVDALGRELPEGVVLYRHGERVERVCPRCAAGEVLVRHEHLPPEDHRIAFGKLLVPGDQDLGQVARRLEEARRRYPGVLLAIPGLYEALGRTQDAGTHHTRWGTIERTALRVG